MRETGFEDGKSPVIQGILRYLESGKDFNGHFWYNVVKSNNDYPHAPWWQTESDSTSHNDYNPTAYLAGFILRFAEKGGELWRIGRRVAREAVETYLSGGMLNDMHTALCFVRLAEYAREAGEETAFDSAPLREKLRLQVRHNITADQGQWENGDICRPSQFFNSRDSAYYAENRALAEYECDYIEKTQMDDGSWPILWNWAEYPEQWAVSKNWWKGNRAVLNLLYLKGMGRL